MTKKDGQVIDIIIRLDERTDSVNVAILGGSPVFGEIYKLLDRARLVVQDQERNALIEQLSQVKKENPDV